jgi:hypothetical protein
LCKCKEKVDSFFNSLIWSKNGCHEAIFLYKIVDIIVGNKSKKKIGETSHQFFLGGRKYKQRFRQGMDA